MRAGPGVRPCCRGPSWASLDCSVDGPFCGLFSGWPLLRSHKLENLGTFLSLNPVGAGRLGVCDVLKLSAYLEKRPEGFSDSRGTEVGEYERSHRCRMRRFYLTKP